MSSISLSTGVSLHAIQTGAVSIKELQRDGAGRSRTSLARVFADRRWTEPLPIYAWLIDHPEGAIVVDTGETARVAERGHFTPWQPYFKVALREWVEPEQEIGPQLRELGFPPEEVPRVVLTHFHTDHAGGLSHFPASEILTAKVDYDLARGFSGKARGFLPQHLPDWFAPAFVELDDGPFGPFDSSRTLTGAGDVRVVPTPGHTPGHLSVVVEDGDTVFFIAADASYTEALMLAGVADGVSPDLTAARDSLTRIQRLVAERPTVYLPAHDPDSAVRLADRQLTRA
jgi:glyoxylase-like metal-dependent hydrolase (beta-lactamase superfamily II)